MTTRDVRIKFGPPGTGKTTILLDTVDELLHRGIEPGRIAYTSFTRQAASEARDRAAARFDFNPDDLHYFRTLHSLAYRALGLTKGDVMQPDDYRTVAEALGLTLTGDYGPETERVPLDGGVGDACLRVYALARARQTTYEAEWRRAEERDLRWPTVRDFIRTLEAFKRDRKALDFSDMLDECATELDVDAFFLDEAQDLTLAQWALARRLGGACPLIYIAGDDDQSLYDWAGASARTLTTLQGERHVLPHSFRLPVAVKALADRVAGRIRYRIPKAFTAREEAGNVRWIADPGKLDLRADGRWLLLARHRHQLTGLAAEARAQGVVYRLNDQWSNDAPAIRAAVLYERLRKGKRVTEGDAKLVARFVVDMQPPAGHDTYEWDDLRWPWGAEARPDWMDGLTRLSVEEMEYLRALRRNGEPLAGPGRVTISTIHGAKGGEADRVVLLTDISRRTLDGLREDPDAEHRVWYVGVSRSKSELILVAPQSQRFWAPPSS